MKGSHDERSGWNSVARLWFEALDHRAINLGERRWVAEVVGIHGDLPHLWIQLESADDSGRSFLLHVTVGTSVDKALAAIAAAARDELDRIECVAVRAEFDRHQREADQSPRFF